MNFDHVPFENKEEAEIASSRIRDRLHNQAARECENSTHKKVLDARNVELLSHPDRITGQCSRYFFEVVPMQKWIAYIDNGHSISRFELEYNEKCNPIWIMTLYENGTVSRVADLRFADAQTIGNIRDWADNLVSRYEYASENV